GNRRGDPADADRDPSDQPAPAVDRVARRRRGRGPDAALGTAARRPHRAGWHRSPRVSVGTERTLMAYGRYYEEFTVGEILKHWPGRTVSEADCTWFALLTMNQNPLHSDAHYQ